jgi:FlaA1/EpsC-like NDP-sugar epimerase
MARELAPGRGIEVDFIGARPGDKDAERFWSTTESQRPANELGLLTIQSPILTDAELETRLTTLRSAVDTRDLAGALAELCALVPDYLPSATVQSLSSHRVSS